MKRFYILLFLLIAAVTVSGCSTKIEKLQGLLDQSEKSLNTTNERLKKLHEKRNEVEVDYNRYISESGKTREEVEAELVKEKSQWGNPPWYQKIKVTWNLLKKCNDYTEIYTKQKAQLDSNIVSLKAMIDSAKLDDEFKKTYVHGDDPELDKAIAEYEVDLKVQPIPWMSDESNNNFELCTITAVSITSAIIIIILIWFICVRVSKSKSLSKIPGLVIKSIDELPALPVITDDVQMSLDTAKKVLFNRVKNDCNEIISSAQKEAVEKLEVKQPESACTCWLEAIKKIREKVNNASNHISADLFKDYLEALDACQKETFNVLSKPYQQSLSQAIKDMESKDPDWDVVATSLEEMLRINPDLFLSKSETLKNQLDVICLHLEYLMKQDVRKGKSVRQRLKKIFEPLFFPGTKAGERETVIINGVKFPFRWCPAGTVTMRIQEEKEGVSTMQDFPEIQRQETLTEGFWMLETPVTIGMFKAFVDETGYTTKGGDPFNIRTGDVDPNISWNKPGYFHSNNYPVTCVSWNDSSEFCKWLGNKIGGNIQLSSEKQWEFGLRAGEEGNVVSYRSLIPISLYWLLFRWNAYPVRWCIPNAWGLFFMKYYGATEFCEYGCVRGAWNLLAKDRRSAIRSHFDYSRGNLIGFRCVKIQ